jgi:hypothetical protein
MKSYTDLEQSKKLVEILPIESADMGWYYSRNPQAARNQMWAGTKAENADISCWSLSALLGVLPVIIGDVLSENALRLRMDKGETNFNVWYENLDSGMVEEGFDIIKSNPVDACYNMIIKLKERNLI